jgi:hypothetical protein
MPIVNVKSFALSAADIARSGRFTDVSVILSVRAVSLARPGKPPDIP